MARNFRVCAKEIDKQTTALQLFGDFDATSACELIDILNDMVKKNDKIAIDTNGLKTINDFGLDVFLPRISRLARELADIQVTGRYSDSFLEA